MELMILVCVMGFGFGLGLGCGLEVLQAFEEASLKTRSRIGGIAILLMSFLMVFTMGFVGEIMAVAFGLAVILTVVQAAAFVLNLLLVGTALSLFEVK